MPITDLTGYTWVGYDNPVADNFGARINFVSNNNSYTYFNLFDNETIFYGGTLVCNIDSGTYWTDNAYKTIVITGGDEAIYSPGNNFSSLLSWLEANGTLTAPTPSGCTITIDGVAYSVDEGDLLVINQTGLYNSTKSSQIYTFISTGGRFLGFNTASGQSSPSTGYGILDTFTALEDLVLYSVEQQPAKTFDLSTLELSSGDHTITVKSTASGYGDSVASNIITYNSSSGGSVLRIYDAAALAEVFEIYSDGVKVAEAPIESAPDNAILDSSGGYIMASDGYLTTTESQVSNN